MGLDMRITHLGDTDMGIDRYNRSGTRQRWGQINDHGGQSMKNLTHSDKLIQSANRHFIIYFP